MQMSLLDIAVKRSGETPEINEGSDKKTLIFVGNKSAVNFEQKNVPPRLEQRDVLALCENSVNLIEGKTTIIQRFLEKNDPIKETMALEYSFTRKSGRSLNKDICHIWELGGGAIFAPLLSTVFGSNTKESVLVVVLDLSCPQTLWITLEMFLQTAFNYVTKAKDETLEKSAKERIPSNHEDKDLITPFPCPLILLGGKYDLFQNFDPEKKKVICRTLRLVAHSLAASLFFYSDKDPNLVKKLKDLFNFYGFGGTVWKNLNVDINKPLSIPFGMDSFEQIGGRTNFNTSKGLALERFKHAFEAQFPQETDTYTIPDDPAKNFNFCEPIIDELRAHKNEDIDRIVERNKRRDFSNI